MSAQLVGAKDDADSTRHTIFRELERVAYANDCTDLVAQIDEYLLEQVYRNLGARGTLEAILRVQGLLDRLVEMERHVDMNEVKQLMHSGECRIAGKTRDGAEVLWLAASRDTRDAKNFDSRVVYFTWCIMWHLRVNLGCREERLIILYDTNRSALDYNFALSKKLAGVVDEISSMTDRMTRVLFVIQNKALRLLTLSTLKLLNQTVQNSIAFVSPQQVQSYLADPSVGSRILTEPLGTFHPDFQTCGNYQHLFERRGFCAISVSDFFGRDLGKKMEMEEMRRQTEEWERLHKLREGREERLLKSDEAGSLMELLPAIPENLSGDW